MSRSSGARLVALFTLACSLGAAGIFAADAKRRFDLAAGDATETLPLFTQQADREIVFSPAAVRGIATKAVVGELAVSEALGRLTEGTRLRITQDSRGGALSVRVVDPVAPAAETPSRSAANGTDRRTARSAASAASGAAVETVQLSPFVVSESGESRYVNSSTLGGTRLRASLRDLATAITVVTAEFMADTGSVNAKDLLVYTPGTETAGLGGNFANVSISGGVISSGGTVGGLNSPNRVRGLSGASSARDYYGTSIPFDSFNTERVEVNRGANAVLFGLGSPAGIINQSTIKPLFTNRYEAELRAKSFGSHRETLDVNSVLIGNVLAVRVAAVNEQERYQQDYAYESNRRIHFGAALRPRLFPKSTTLSETTVRASAEFGQLYANRPRILPPNDHVTAWFKPWIAGDPVKITWNPSTQAHADRNQLLGVGWGQMFRAPTIIFENPRQGTIGTSAYPAGTAGFQGVLSNAVRGLNGAIGTSAFESLEAPNVTRALARANDPDGSFYLTPTFLDERVFNFRDSLLDGPNKYNNTNFSIVSASVEQRFLQDLFGIELGVNRERYTQQTSDIGGGRPLSVDVNTHLPSGVVNPNFGRVFFSEPGGRSRTENDRRDGRATAFLQLDPARFISRPWAKWLGRHTGSMLLGRTITESRNASSGGHVALADPFLYGTGSEIDRFNANAAYVNVLHYLSGSLSGLNSPVGAGISGLTAPQVVSAAGVGTQSFILRDQTATGTFRPVQLRLLDEDDKFSQMGSAASFSRNDTRTRAAVLQSHLLAEHLVGLAGWRKDAVEAFNAAAPLRAAGGNVVPDSLFLPAAPNLSRSAVTHTYSATGHLPAAVLRRLPLLSSLSVFGGRSENFSGLDARVDVYGRQIEPASGQTREAGLGVGFWRDRVRVRVNRYETSQVNVSANVGTSAQAVLALYSTLIGNTIAGLNPGVDPRNLAASGLTVPPADLLTAYRFTQDSRGNPSINGPSNVVNTTDFVSRGVEMELSFTPSPNWDFSANAARQEAIRSNSANQLWQLWAVDKQLNGQTLRENWLGPVGQRLLSATSSTLANSATISIDNPLRNFRAADGALNPELRKWRFNAVTNYRFGSGSVLRGFSVGGALRWQDRVAIGYPNITVGTGRVIDVARPFFGPPDTKLDAWVGYRRRILGDRFMWRVQLNVRDLMNRDDLVPVATQPTGEIAGVRIPEGRIWSLTSSFSF